MRLWAFVWRLVLVLGVSGAVAFVLCSRFGNC